MLRLSVHRFTVCCTVTALISLWGHGWEGCLEKGLNKQCRSLCRLYAAEDYISSSQNIYRSSLWTESVHKHAWEGPVPMFGEWGVNMMVLLMTLRLAVSEAISFGAPEPKCVLSNAQKIKGIHPTCTVSLCLHREKYNRHFCQCILYLLCLFNWIYLPKDEKKIF